MENVVYASDRVDVVRCRDCKHRMREDREFPDGICPLQDFYGDIDHVRRVPDDWFCADGERRDERGEAGEQLEGAASASE